MTRCSVRDHDKDSGLAAEVERLTAELEQLRASYAGLEQQLAEQARELAEAREQQAATAEVLSIISRSPTDLQSVLDTVIERATRLCGAVRGSILRTDGVHFWRVGTFNVPQDAPALPLYTVDRDTPAGEAILTAATVQVSGTAEEVLRTYPGVAHVAGTSQFHQTRLSVPLLREGKALGVLILLRPGLQPFTDQQVALVETFADQVVIAIENARLFEELQERNRELTESLAQQTAVAGVLQTISRSAFDLQAVLDALVEQAARLGDSPDVMIGVIHDGQLLWVSGIHHGRTGTERVIAPIPLMGGMEPGTTIWAAVEGRQTIMVSGGPEGIARDYPKTAESWRYLAERGDILGSSVYAPLLRDDTAIGVLVVRRPSTDPYTSRQVSVLQTFADQAVIAIENVRLFDELQTRNRELTEALEQQTATAEILHVISRSPTDLDAVLGVVAENAARVCGAKDASIWRVDGPVIRKAVGHGALAAQTAVGTEARIDALGGFAARAVRDRQTVHVFGELHEVAREWPEVAPVWQRVGARSGLATPLLLDGIPIGVIRVLREEPRPFTDKQIVLLETFANQAVIAIDNTRLFEELQTRNRELTEALEQQTATAEVLRIISSSPNALEVVLNAVAERAARLAGATDAVIGVVEGDTVHLLGAFNPSPDVPLGARGPLRDDLIWGRAVLEHRTIHVSGTAEEIEPEFPAAAARMRHVGRAHLTALSMPLLRDGDPIGHLQLRRWDGRPFSERQIAVAQMFADQAVIAIENTRLFEEIQAKTRELEEVNQQLAVASRHKSEFLANMSHELRTPLNAIIGFTEVLAERMFGDINDKQEEYLQDVLSSARHLLSLINDILDLSKVEAGRMELEISRFSLREALHNSLTTLRERAGRHGIALDLEVDPALDVIEADERKVKQVLFNLLSNAVKFTPDRGRVDVSARLVDGAVEIAVRDTGIGIAPEDQARIFEEFRQTHHGSRAEEGTGLGLALTRRFVELHGGRIWVESTPGEGSTFTFTLPAAARQPTNHTVV